MSRQIGDTSMAGKEHSEEVAARRRWISVLAGATAAELEVAWEGLPSRPSRQFLRAPETGMVMVRGRAGGTGRRFNLGEMTVTRCAVRLDDGTVGHGYVAGRSPRHAELAAAFDALMLREDAGAAAAVETLARSRDERRSATAAKTASTKVDFFTVVRGEN